MSAKGIRYLERENRGRLISFDDLPEEIKKILSEIIEYEREIYLFGSYYKGNYVTKEDVANGRAETHSDIDLFVSSEKNISRIKTIGEKYGFKIDVVFLKDPDSFHNKVKIGVENGYIGALQS